MTRRQRELLARARLIARAARLKQQHKAADGVLREVERLTTKELRRELREDRRA